MKQFKKEHFRREDISENRKTFQKTSTISESTVTFMKHERLNS